MSIISPTRLIHFKEWVELETGRPVVVQPIASESAGFHVLFVPNDKNILINFDADWNPDSEELEYALAHEMTHGLLHYKHNYPFIYATPGATQTETAIGSIIASMIEDAAAQRILQDRGFYPIQNSNVAIFQEHLKALKGSKPFDKFAGDPQLLIWRIIQRYIVAWLHVKYCTLRPEHQTLLNKFLNACRLKRPNEYLMGKEIIVLFNQNNVLTREGYIKIIQGIILKWNLKDALVIG
jgi:hypothetical protein